MNGPRTAGYAPPLDMKQAGTYYPKSTPCPVTHPDSQRKVLELEFRVIDELQMIHAVPGNMRRHYSILFRCHGFFILSILTDLGSIRPPSGDTNALDRLRSASGSIEDLG